MKYIIYSILFFIFFNDLNAQYVLPQTISISDAENFAMLYKPELKKISYKISSIKGKYLIGISPQMPELSLSYDFIPSGSTIEENEERSLEIKQNIEFPIKTIYKGDQYDNEIEIVKAENEVIILNVINSVRKAYIIVLEKSALIKIAEENCVVAQEFLTKSLIRFNAGEENNLEKLTAEVQYAQALNNLEIIKNQYRIALNDLFFCMGIKEININYNPVLSDSLFFKPYSDNQDIVLNNTKKYNPTLRLYELKKSGTQINKNIAKSSYLPDFSVGYKRQSINGLNDYYGFNFSISLPLWFMFEQKGKIQEANAEINILENESDEILLEILNSVKNTYVNLKNSEKQITLFLNVLIPQSEEIFRIANASYQSGEITYLEYLQAKHTFISTKENYITILKEYNLNIIELEKVIGKKIL